MTEFKTQRKFKTEFEIQYDNHDDDKTSSTSCPPMWCQPARSSRGRRGPLDGPTRRKRLSNPGRTDLLEVSGDTTCSKGYNNNPEYTNTQQVLPDYGIYLADS